VVCLTVIVKIIAGHIKVVLGSLGTESASRPPYGFWRIDDQQLEI
jgi:hypothetical protein